LQRKTLHKTINLHVCAVLFGWSYDMFNLFYRAADWNLAEPTWTGRLRIVSVGDACTLNLEDRNNGELFAKCPIEQYPGVALESVSDSSRYFVVRIQDENGMCFITSFQYFM